MLDDLMLLSGVDIPFAQAQINIHPPKIKEIAYIGEEMFFAGSELLNLSKDILITEDKTSLENISNFEILMSMVKDNNLIAQRNKISMLMVLTLIFPGYDIKILENQISFSKEGEDIHYINSQNFEEFKIIISKMFCLKERNPETDYNPSGSKARAIAEKMKKGRQKAAAAKNEQKKIDLLSRYISILAVGEGKSLNELLNYTVYQLFDEFNRFELKQKHDMYIQLKIAGAKDLDELENWTKDIHS